MRLASWSSRLATAATLAVLLVSCGEESARSSDPISGTISGTISYDGPAAGGGRALSIAVYSTYPPKGPPLVTQLIQSYQLPYRYQFVGLGPGTYYVGALIDVDPSDTRYPGMLNAKRDPYGFPGGGALPAPVTVEQLKGAGHVDIRLEDPR